MSENESLKENIIYNLIVKDVLKEHYDWKKNVIIIYIYPFIFIVQIMIK